MATTSLPRKTSHADPVGRTHRTYDHVETLTAVLEMERNGVNLDTELCAQIAQEAAANERAALDDLRAWGREHSLWMASLSDQEADEVWSSSTVGLPRFLHSKEGLGLRPSPIFAKGRVKDGEVSTDHAAIDFLASHNPEHRAGLKRLIRLRQDRSALKYTTKWPRFIQHDGLIHPVFSSRDSDGGKGGTVTERETINSPEFAQAPRNAKKDHYGLRRLFKAPEGQVIVAVDAQALEVVVLADYLIWRLDDSRLAERLTSPVDIHSQTVADLFPDLGLTGEQVAKGKGGWPEGVELAVGHLPSWAWADQLTLENIALALTTVRDEVAKVTRYAIHYGKGEWGLGHTMLDPKGDPIGEETAGKLIRKFLGAEPWLDRYMDEVWWRLSRFGGITALDGHALDTRTLWANGKSWRWSAFRKGLNYPMQHGAAALVSRWMYLVAIDPEIRALGGRLRLQIHDELVLTAPQPTAARVVQRVKECLDDACRALGLLVPLASKGGIGPTWHEAK